MRTIVVVAILFLSIQFNNAQEDTKNDIKFTKSSNRGAIIYDDFCVTCHLPNGKGVAKTFPPLAKSDYLMNKRAASIKAVKFGQKGEITVNGETYNSVMSSPGLSEDEIADVMNYISNSWGNKSTKMVTTQEVLTVQKK